MGATIILTLILLAVALLLLAVRIILKKNGQFSSQHISQNKRMQQNGITCANAQDHAAQRNNKKLKISEL